MPDYSSRWYWKDRLLSEDSEGFEWLVSSEDILPHIAPIIEESRIEPARVLHFGCGSSTLGADLQRRFGKLVNVYDADYAISETERKFLLQRFTDSGIETPRVLHLDALNSQQMIDCSPPGGWNLLVDKSTADAIACGEPIATTAQADTGPATHDPIEVLCRNLRRVTSADAAWVSISYSASRFEFLQGAEHRHGWRVESKIAIRHSGSEAGGIVHRPVTATWVWVLRRI